ncbi:hypothetical protein G7Y89_g4829 [Cudoniella acicularis]|uniref:FAD-binding domain-containing protein n=1 Tax=Cudoniella acicularis TaxID=354080 RepID=A0A8H4W3X4_9HELO|nr:hypothetical protein G7Y89_g4829 [Cudoniella acicularis]
MSAPRIAIIGAGPGGLTLASILQKNGVKCTIFELDASRTSRDQGGIVDLHSQAGQLALREAGILGGGGGGVEKNTIPLGEAMKLIKSDGTVCWDESHTKHVEHATSRDRPEILRSKLRDILLDSVEPASIQWNRKLVRVEQAEGTHIKYNLHFTDSVEEGFDLVVGTDGAWSRVRPLVTDVEPHYSGVTIVELKAAQASTKKQWLSNFMGTGTLFMFDKDRALASGNLGLGLWNRLAKARICKESFGKRYFADCHADLKCVIASEASNGLITRPLYMLPIGTKWAPRAGITLLGDAAHLITPFAGVGVNVTMADALSLSRAIIERKDDFGVDPNTSLAEAIKEYEEPMFERARENMEMTWSGLEGHFSVDGIDQLVRLLEGQIKMEAMIAVEKLETS